MKTGYWCIFTRFMTLRATQRIFAITLFSISIYILKLEGQGFIKYGCETNCMATKL